MSPQIYRSRVITVDHTSPKGAEPLQVHSAVADGSATVRQDACPTGTQDGLVLRMSFTLHRRSATPLQNGYDSPIQRRGRNWESCRKLITLLL
jgi:hypothetical protein